MIRAAAVAFAGCLLAVPVAMRLAHRWGVLDRPGPLKPHDQAVPYLGGLGVMVALAAGLLASPQLWDTFPAIAEPAREKFPDYHRHMLDLHARRYETVAAAREKLRQEFRFEHNIPFDALLIGTVGELKLLKGQRDFVLAAKIVAG